VESILGLAEAEDMKEGREFHGAILKGYGALPARAPPSARKEAHKLSSTDPETRVTGMREGSRLPGFQVSP